MTPTLLSQPAQLSAKDLWMLRGGAHYNLVEPGQVTFIMQAPFKPFVSLVGDFNDWNSQANGMLTDGSGIWWTTIPHPGPTRYGFYVAVDEQSHVWVGDPYATEVHWDRTGPWAYLPERETLMRRANYGWHDQEWRTPALRDLVIYELGIRDFCGEWRGDRPVYGTFQGLLDELDYLAKLEINAIELMPIHQFPGKSSWGYNPVFYFAPARTYGTVEDFKQLVDACHRKGIAVLLDVVFNHSPGDHPYYQIYPAMYGPQGEELFDWNPFFHHTPESVNMWGGVDWDHFAAETTRYFQQVLRFWLEEYHLDGFRFDWVGGVDYDSSHPMQPGFNPYHGISALCWAARQTKPDCILIGEYWPLAGTNPKKTAAKLVADTEMDSVWNGQFHHTLDDILNQRWQWERKDVFRAIGGFREQGFTQASQVVNYTCSHDEVRPEHEIKFYSNRHIVRPPKMSLQELALTKARLGLLALFGAPGVPMIYAGQEFGEDSPRTIDFLPLNWDKLDKRLYQHHYRLVRRLIRARRQHPALCSDHIEFFANDFAKTQLVRFRRWDASGDFALVALNFSGEKRATCLPFPWDGRWRDVVKNRAHRVKGGLLDFTLKPWDGRFYVPEEPDRGPTRGAEA